MTPKLEKAIRDAVRYLDAQTKRPPRVDLSSPGVRAAHFAEKKEADELRAALLEAFDLQKAEGRRGGWVCIDWDDDATIPPIDTPVIAFIEGRPGTVNAWHMERHLHQLVWRCDLRGGYYVRKAVAHWMPMPSAPLTIDAADAQRWSEDEERLLEEYQRDAAEAPRTEETK